MEDPLYNPSVIPTLYAKIGALTVRSEMLAANNQELIAEIRRLQELLPEGAQIVDITTLTEEEQEAIRNPEPSAGPSQEDLIRQIEADYLVAERNGDSKAMTELDEKHARVKAAPDDSKAHKAYAARPTAKADHAGPPIR